MADKFTFEEHQKRMREILDPPANNIANSLLERIRGRGRTTPLPRLPRLPIKKGV